MSSILIQRRKPYFDGTRFYNYKGEPAQSFFDHAIKGFFQSLPARTIRKSFNPEMWLKPSPIKRFATKPTITWIGHATFLIQLSGLNILTDPIFGNASILYPRLLRPGIELSQLPPIDVVLISHNHPDHMDVSTLSYLMQEHKPLFLVPTGDGSWFTKKGYKNVQELTWWQEYFISTQSTKFTFLPSFHWSQRTPWDKNRSLWGSWMITEDSFSCYFAGDTAYSSHFSHIAQVWGRPIDIALLPIAPCEPFKEMRTTHMDAAQAGQAVRDLNALRCVPMHWGAFQFGTDYFIEPVAQLVRWWHEQSMARYGYHLDLMLMGTAYTYDYSSAFMQSALTSSVPSVIKTL
ncbi:MBL fold metallo-hydrolase [Vermiphilus pyriformis]|nr:MAG: MBL fold metallo-hydrolase [Vermiphilus pyriformis]